MDNIEAIKLRALENFYCLKIFQKREEEIKMLRKTALINSVISGFNELVPASSTLFMLLYYTFLRPQTVIKYQQFVQFSQIFDSIKSQSITLIGYWSYLIEIQVSLKRVDEFFKSEDKIDQQDVKMSERYEENSELNQTILKI